jgi:phage terminase large subunit-like protein
VNKTTYPHWVFDDSPIDDPFGYGERAVRFFDALKHPLSSHDDRRFGLPRFWERIIRRIYGPRNPDGTRIVRQVFIMIPRGARKTTTIGGGLGLLHSIGHEKVTEGQVFLGAASEDQAELAYDEAVSMIRATPALRDRVKVRGNYIEHPEARSRLVVLSGAGDVAMGTTPSAIFLDELHVFPNRKLWKALKTGMRKRVAPLLVVTTTAGRGQTGLGWDEYQYARRVSLGEIDNPRYLPVIFEPPPNAKWDDEKIWHMVNPGLAEGFPVLEEMRQDALEAKDRPGELEDFKTYALNMWSDAATSPFVDMGEVYPRGAEPIDLEKLKGLPCWLAVDLSSRIDLSVIVAAWRTDDDGYVVLPFFFCPTANLREREERTGAPYTAWEKAGLITATPGNSIDYRSIENRLRKLCGPADPEDLASGFDVQEIAFDPAFANQIMSNLSEDGLPVVEHRQGSLSMMPGYAELERVLIAGKFQHGNHPVLKFCFGNVEAVRNKAGHVTHFTKSKKWLSIDGAQAAAMAVGRAMRGDSAGEWSLEDVTGSADGEILFF